MIDSSKIDLVKNFISNGFTTREIAAELGMSQNFVMRFLKRNNLKTKSIRRGGKLKTKPKSLCVVCGKELEKAQAKYCSMNCQLIYKDSIFINDWLKNGYPFTITRRDHPRMQASIRRHLMKESGGKCIKCGFSGVNKYSGNSILEIHHIDGRFQNNDRGNLELLCPNCHAMTPTHRSLNRGKNRLIV